MNQVMKADGRPLRLYGLTEVAQVLGIQKQPAQRALKRPGAPAPLAELAMGAVWDADDVEAWASTRRTKPGPAPAEELRVCSPDACALPVSHGGRVGCPFTDRAATVSEMRAEIRKHSRSA